MKTLENFYLEYLHWIENDAPELQPFTREDGLCLNLMAWDNEDGKPMTPLLKEMQGQFIKSGFGTVCPFNDESNPYYYEFNFKRCHLNEKRIQWVKDRVHEICYN